MISVNVLTDNNLWKKKIVKPQIFFNNILKKFPKKYLFKDFINAKSFFEKKKPYWAVRS